MKILLSCTSVSWGGLEQIVLRDALALRNMGIEVHILGPGDGVLFERAREKKFDYHIVHSTRSYLNFELIFKLRRLIKKHKFDLIHIHRFNTIFPQLFAVRWIKIPVVATRHIYVEHKKKDLFHRWYLKRLDRLFAISDFARSNLIETYPLSEDKIETLYLGINLKKYKRTREKSDEFKKAFSIPDSKKIIGVIGRIDPMKGQMEFIDSAPNILKKYPETHFVIVGRTTSDKYVPYMESLKARIKELKLEESFTFTGFCDDVSIPMSAMDVFVMPSYFEAFGLIALEAMACEVPVVATNRGSIDEIIPSEDYGLRIEPKSSKDISSAVIKLLASKELMSKIKTNAFKRVRECFDEKVYFRNLINIYKELTG